MMRCIMAAPRDVRIAVAVIADAFADRARTRCPRCIRTVVSIRAVAARAVAFAQIRAIGLARAGNPPLAKKYFRAGSGAPKRARAVPRMRAANPRMRRHAGAAGKKCLKKSGFHATASVRPRTRARTAASRVACGGKAIRLVRGRARKKTCGKVLTAEKSVIRFRPADVSCRSE
jgi:hypothetical protein